MATAGKVARHIWILLGILFLGTVASGMPCGQVVAGKLAVRDASRAPLSDFVHSRRPWLPLEADSEQGGPLYLGALPREMALGLPLKDRPEIPSRLKALGEAQATRLAKLLGETAIELEAWPSTHWKGYLTWTFARYRRSPDQPWQWLDASVWEATKEIQYDPDLPHTLEPWRTGSDAATVFKDFLELDDLYGKPVFGDCVWTNAAGDEIVGAWLPPSRKSEYRPELARGRFTARALHQPAWFNADPISFVVKVSGETVEFPPSIHWFADEEARATPITTDRQVARWPRDYDRKYQRDVETIAGEKSARFPVSGRRACFEKKSCAQKDHDLDKMVDYLEERYQRLGIRTVRQRFVWRGIPQSNLIAIIPGTLEGKANRPVLMADHIDTAFCENVFNKSGERVTSPGADDNSTAVAALLRAAEILKNTKPRHDIWLVHLTGEEFPSDGLGARHFLSSMLAAGQDFSGLVLMDMIGWHRRNDRVFQVNAGPSKESVELAELALGAALDLAPELKAVYRSRFDPRSYLYNTDGILFAQMGYPVILLNEHLNGINMRHPHYHQSSDVSENVDFAFASAISRVAIETALRLARIAR